MKTLESIGAIRAAVAEAEELMRKAAKWHAECEDRMGDFSPGSAAAEAESQTVADASRTLDAAEDAVIRLRSLLRAAMSNC